MMDRLARGQGVVVEEHTDGVVHIILDRPNRANALSDEIVSTLQDTIRMATAGESCAVAITASGRSFCAGIDMSDLEGASDNRVRDRFRRIDHMLDLLATAPFVTVAALDGPAVGAGADLVLACDHRIGGPNGTLQFPGPQFGVLLGTVRLAQRVGTARAQSIVLAQQALGSQAALDSGLLTELVASERLESTAEQITQAAAEAKVDVSELVRLTRGLANSSKSALEMSMGSGIADRMRSFAKTSRK